MATPVRCRTDEFARTANQWLPDVSDDLYSAALHPSDLSDGLGSVTP